MRAKVSAILFDLHGTLIHQTRCIEDHLQCAFQAASLSARELSFANFVMAWESIEIAERGAVVESVRVLESGDLGAAKRILIELPLEERFRSIHQHLKAWKTLGWIEPATENFQNSWMGGLELGAESIDLLNYLDVRYSLGIVTNFKDGKRIREWLASQRLSQYFAGCQVVSGDLGIRKPHPELFLTALGRLGVFRPGDALMVGDDPIEDAAGASIVGMQSQLITAMDFSSLYQML